jgi:hypothetical protein
VSTLNIILLSGKKSEAQPGDGEYPEYLCEYNGKPLIHTLIDNCAALEPRRIICTFSNEDVIRLHLRNMVQQMHPLPAFFPFTTSPRALPAPRFWRAGKSITMMSC